MHRWLGIALGLLFAVWFASGIVMVYVRMPSVTAGERFAHAQPIDAAAIRVPPAVAAARAGARPGSPLTVAMLGARPVYRFDGARPVTVFADTLELFAGSSAEQALELARMAMAGGRAAMSYGGRLESRDQWTLQLGSHLPLHRIALGDAADTELYLSDRTGEIVMDTTRRERAWAYAGPVAHWLYLPALRRNGPLWTRVIVASSLAGCVLCLSGLVAGAVRAWPFLRGGPVGQRLSPYAGWMKWHHYAGLLFGLFAFTWTFSGLLSMGPFAYLSGGGPTSGERHAVAGDGPSRAPSLEELEAAIAAAQAYLAPKELRLTQFRGQACWIASASARLRVIVPATGPGRDVRRSFPREDVEAAARDAAPAGAEVVDLAWLDGYDAYYYDPRGERPLPVLRARYDDAESTWLYLDPAAGSIALVARRRDRANRWLYHGLHSLDVAWLRGRRPLWDVVIVVLSLGGLATALLSLGPALRRLARIAGGLARLQLDGARPRTESDPR